MKYSDLTNEEKRAAHHPSEALLAKLKEELGKQVFVHATGDVCYFPSRPGVETWVFDPNEPSPKEQHKQTSDRVAEVVAGHMRE